MRFKMLPLAAVTAALLLVVVIGVSGCGSPVTQDPPTAAEKAAVAKKESDSSAAFQAGPDTAGDIKAVWKAESGTARQDPIGLLSGTPLLLEGDHLRAKVTAPFKPNSPNAQSADGKYVYTLELTESPSRLTFKGTMTIDWTMTIVWSATSRNEFHSVYTADVTAYYNSLTKTLRDGVAKGTAKTTDTGITSGSAPAPHTSTAPFTWTFEGE
jgi:hypothetical protein